MAEPENLFLIYLRRLDEKLDRVIADVHDLKVRMTSVEEMLARVQLDIADVRLDIAGINRRIDRVDHRLDRIERRLDLVEDPAAPIL